MKLIIADMEDFNIPVEGEYKVIRVNADNYDGLVKGVSFYKSLEELKDVVL